jgi:ABC-type lipoprotein export system ATPase subunit
VIVAQTTLVACRGVSVVHGRGASAVTALADVEIAIAAGERVSLTGRSGSGKTTLLHVLGGLVAPTAGEVLLHGRELPAHGSATVGYVFQGANLLPTFTAFENVSFARYVAGTAGNDAGGTPRAVGNGRDDELTPEQLLGLVGLAAKLDHLPGELSGGEAQRVAVARALAGRPELLLCDEPTGQLDSDTGARVLDLIDALQRELGFALVIATHDPDVAARAARVVTLEDGRISADEELG